MYSLNTATLYDELEDDTYVGSRQIQDTTVQLFRHQVNQTLSQMRVAAGTDLANAILTCYNLVRTEESLLRLTDEVGEELVRRLLFHLQVSCAVFSVCSCSGCDYVLVDKNNRTISLTVAFRQVSVVTSNS